MVDLTNSIYQEVSTGKNVLLIGPTNSGKTWYIKNTLIPFLNKKEIKVNYFENLEVFQITDDKNGVYIIDEFETLIDRGFLETRSAKPGPYYSKEYIAKVSGWHAKIKKLNAPSIFVLTRNNMEEIDNIISTLKIADWGTKVTCFEFSPAT